MAHQCTLQYAAICCLGHFDCSVSSCDLSVLERWLQCLSWIGRCSGILEHLYISYSRKISDFNPLGGRGWRFILWWAVLVSIQKYFDLFISFKKIAVTHFCCRSDKSWLTFLSGKFLSLDHKMMVILIMITIRMTKGSLTLHTLVLTLDHLWLWFVLSSVLRTFDHFLVQADNEIGEKRKEIFLTVNYKPRCDCQKKMTLKKI